MNRQIPFRFLCALATLTAPAEAEIIDRIAVSVGNSVITASDLGREVRVTAFLNGVKPDFSPAARRATAERLVEQKLVRRELELSRYPLPDPSATEVPFDGFRQAHFQTAFEFNRALAGAGLTEQEIKDALLWQLTLLRFIEVRFRPGVQVNDEEIEDYFEKTVKPAAQAAHPSEPVSLEDYRDQIRETLTGQRSDQDLDRWLQESRQRTEIHFHEEVFE